MEVISLFLAVKITMEHGPRGRIGWLRRPKGCRISVNTRTERKKPREISGRYGGHPGAEGRECFGKVFNKFQCSRVPEDLCPPDLANVLV